MGDTETLRTLDEQSFLQWKRDGYIIIRSLFGPGEIAALSD